MQLVCIFTGGKVTAVPRGSFQKSAPPPGTVSALFWEDFRRLQPIQIHCSCCWEAWLNPHGNAAAAPRVTQLSTRQNLRSKHSKLSALALISDHLNNLNFCCFFSQLILTLKSGSTNQDPAEAPPPKKSWSRVYVSELSSGSSPSLWGGAGQQPVTMETKEEAWPALTFFLLVGQM